MFKKLQVTAVLLCVLSYAEAATVSIGTVSARGDMRVDSYGVKGNATLFDGSVVETNEASADLRLQKGAEITLSAASRGTIYSDHLVLQRGEGEIKSAGAYQLQANGLRVIPSDSGSRGVVSVKSDNVIEVASLSGNIGVTNGQGVTLANILPGHAYSFAMQAGGNGSEFSGVGLVSFDNGTYYLTTDGNVRYILTCKDSHAFVGDKVVVTGTLQGSGAGAMLCVKTMDINGPGGGGISSRTKWIIAGVAIAGAGAGAALAVSNQSTTSASR